MKQSDIVEQDLALLFSAITLGTSLLILCYEVGKNITLFI